MGDLAHFPRPFLLLIWGRYPACVYPECKRSAMDWHHIKKRGNSKDKQDRKIHSSVFNAAPVCREHHTDGTRHDFEIEQLYLNRVRDRINAAGHNPTSIDVSFLQKYAECY